MADLVGVSSCIHERQAEVKTLQVHTFFLKLLDKLFFLRYSLYVTDKFITGR